MHPHKDRPESDVDAAEGVIGALDSLAMKHVETGPSKQRRERREKLFVPPVKWFEATAALSRLRTGRAALLWHLIRMQTKLDGEAWIVPRLSFLIEAGLRSHKARSRAIEELERARLVEVRRRPGKSPLLRLLPIVESDA